MDIATDTRSLVDRDSEEQLAPEKRARVVTPNGDSVMRERNLAKMAKKNNMREKIIVDVIDDDITRVDSISTGEMDEYNREYDQFMSRARDSMPYPVEKVMVANIGDYLRYSSDSHPAMVYFSDELKIPLITLDNGREIKPHSSSIGIYYILEGKGSIQVGMKNFAIKPGSLIHVPKGVVRSIYCDDSLKIMAIHIS